MQNTGEACALRCRKKSIERDDAGSQNAPKRIAPTNANTANTASTLSLSARSTSRPPTYLRSSSLAGGRRSSNDKYAAPPKATARITSRVGGADQHPDISM